MFSDFADIRGQINTIFTPKALQSALLLWPLLRGQFHAISYPCCHHFLNIPSQPSRVPSSSIYPHSLCESMGSVQLVSLSIHYSTRSGVYPVHQPQCNLHFCSDSLFVIWVKTLTSLTWPLYSECSWSSGLPLATTSSPSPRQSLPYPIVILSLYKHQQDLILPLCLCSQVIPITPRGRIQILLLTEDRGSHLAVASPHLPPPTPQLVPQSRLLQKLCSGLAFLQALRHQNYMMVPHHNTIDIS